MQINATHTIEVDLRQNTIIPLPQFKQNDTNIIDFVIKDNGVDADLSNVGDVIVNYRRPDNVVVSRYLTISGNTVTYEIGTDEMKKSGQGSLEIVFYNQDNSQRISTKIMNVVMNESIGTDQVYTNNDNYTVLETLINDTNTATTNANNAADAASTAATNAQNVADDNITNWLDPVSTYADIATTYTSPLHGDTVMTQSDGKIYRYLESTNGWKLTQVYNSTAINDVQNKLSDQATQTTTLQHGLQAITTDQASPLKPTFYGRSLVNHPGKQGGFESQGQWDSNLTIDTSTYKSGLSSGKIDNSGGATYKFSLNNQKLHLSGKYVLVGFWTKAVSGTPTINAGFVNYDSSDTPTGSQLPQFTVDSTWNFYYFTVDMTTDTNAYSKLRATVVSYGTADDVVNFDGLFIYEVSQDTYNKIDVLSDYTGDALADKFPYVNSVQHVFNPMIKGYGKNLIPPFTSGKWTLDSHTKVISDYDLELDATAAIQVSVIKVKVSPNTTYTLSMINSQGTNFSGLDANGSIVSTYSNNYYISPITITTASNVVELSIQLFNYTATGTFTFTNPQLELGSTATTFQPQNESYIYASQDSNKNPILLASNNDGTVADELYFRNNQAYRLNRFTRNMVLDGSINWIFSTDYSGYKKIRSNTNYNSINYSETVVKYDGSISQSSQALNLSSQVAIYNGSLNLNLSDTDSGWGETYTPTANEIKAYFYGYKKTGYSATDATTAPTLAVSGTGSTLPAGTYYVKYTWVTATGETLASTEASITTTSGQEIDVTLPVFPSGVTQANIYISSATGTETLQGNTVTTTYAQTVALVTGAALPSSNTTTGQWTPIGDTNNTRAVTTVPTSDAPTIAEGTIDHYKLTYQLANSVEETVLVEGSLDLIQGGNQIEVGEGVIVREKVTPYAPDSSSAYRINNHYQGNSDLNYSAKDILKIYKNKIIDNQWTIVYSNDNGNANGDVWAEISRDKYDPSASYEVTYLPLNLYKLSSAENNVSVDYNTNLKTVVNELVTENEDNKTQISSHTYAIAELYRRVVALGG